MRRAARIAGGARMRRAAYAASHTSIAPPSAIAWRSPAHCVHAESDRIARRPRGLSSSRHRPAGSGRNRARAEPPNRLRPRFHANAKQCRCRETRASSTADASPNLCRCRHRSALSCARPCALRRRGAWPASNEPVIRRELARRRSHARDAVAEAGRTAHGTRCAVSFTFFRFPPSSGSIARFVARHLPPAGASRASHPRAALDSRARTLH
ncbi:hypothetical protein X962_5419 [Burkholderia pseudomallei MSHR7343]|nr:hypothetical protein X962_5419 [Burkholderia pseudomallei MSHR7343]